MKILLSIIILVTMFNVCNAQVSNKEKRQSKVGISFSSFGANDVIRYQELDGGVGYDSDNFYTLGVNYLHTINNWITFETGLEYSKHSIIVVPNYMPKVENEAYKNEFSLINIPITVRLNFLKYLFFNGGLIVDIDAAASSSIDSQTGIGGIIGVGTKYDFAFGASIFANPYFKAHALLPFSSNDYQQRIMETGIRIGLTYNLN